MAPPWLRPAAVGAALVATCVAVRILLQPVLGSQFGFMFFFPATVAACVWAGRMAGYVAAGLSALVIWYVWLPPEYSFGLAGDSAIHLVIFVVVACAMVHLVAEGQAARTREAQLRGKHEAMLRSMADAVFATDSAARVTFMNEGAERLLGIRFDEARGAEIETVLPISADGTQAPQPSLARRAVSERAALPPQNGRSLRLKSGAEIAVVESAAPIVGREGDIQGAVLLCRDVTAEAAAKRALEASNRALADQVADLAKLRDFASRVFATSSVAVMLEETLRGALEASRSDMGLLSLADAEGLRVEASRGFPAETVERIRRIATGSGPCGQCFQTRARVVVEDVRIDPLCEPLREWAQAANFRSVHSTPLLRRDGTVVGVLSTHSPQPRRPSEREIQLLDMFARHAADAIENAQLRERAENELRIRTAAEDELRVTDGRFRLAAHVKGLTLFEQDLALRYVWLYPSHAEHASALGRTDAEIVPAEEAAVIVQLKEAILRDGETRQTVVAATLADGIHYYDTTVVARRDSAGAVVGLIGTAFDVTELKAAQADLVNAHRAMEALNADLERRVRESTAELRNVLVDLEGYSYTVSHDLRAPLRAIRGYIEILREDYLHALDHNGRALLGRVVGAVERMHGLIDKLLAFARINGAKVEPVPVDLRGTLLGLVADSPELQEPHATVVVPDSLPTVLGTEVFVAQALANLLANAIKFVPKDRRPRVEIMAEPRGRFARVWVVDNGIGIPPQDCGKLFNLFERLDAASAYAGHGMGLAIVRRAVSRMGGTVGVESDGRTGSRFWLELPAFESGADAAPGQPATVPNPT